MRSILLLLGFPAVLASMVWLFLFLYMHGTSESGHIDYTVINELFAGALPIVMFGVGIWFLIAWLGHSSMISKATSATSLERKSNMRVYNLTENLCMSRGISMPKLQVIEDDSLNAYASGISKNTYTIALSRGIINKLNDDELEAVIAHELTHITNRDVRLLIVSVIFVGVFAFVAQMALRAVIYGGSSRGNKKDSNVATIALLAVAVFGYLISIIFKFALSRKREYLADAGAAELTKNPRALASALRKISGDPWIESVQREDVAQMFIEHPKAKNETEMGFASMFSGIFATHPPIKKRIQILEQI
jgi:heat shock protein HtpX